VQNLWKVGEYLPSLAAKNLFQERKNVHTHEKKKISERRQCSQGTIKIKQLFLFFFSSTLTVFSMVSIRKFRGIISPENQP
jgi:uncharacterized DUF497 family protein